MPFELYKRQRVRVSGEPTISILARGIISLSPSAYEILGCPEKAEFRYDPDRRLVAIQQAAGSAGASAYRVRAVTRKGIARSYVLSGAAFIAHYGISTEGSRRWLAREQDGMLVIDLNEPGVRVTSNRARG